MSTEISATGRISRVEAKFAYISSDRGSVFCPIAAALPNDSKVSTLTSHYHVGDIVHFMAVPQKGKNDCNFLATKVRLSARSHEYQGDLETRLENEIVKVVSVTTTLAYGQSEKLGSVFIPGAAFPPEEVSRLDAYIVMGDELMVTVRQQSEKNGCRWIALSATKYQPEKPKTIAGRGKITEMTKTLATVWCERCGIVKCPLLTWIGGDYGTDVEFLNDFLKIGQEVLFEAEQRKEGLRATRWASRTTVLPKEYAKPMCDSYTQTSLSADARFIRALDPHLLEQLFEQKPILRFLLNMDNSYESSSGY